MTAFNIVRLRVKPGREEEFLAAHRAADSSFAGFRQGTLVKTGEGTFCFVGEWSSMDRIVAARPQMIALLDGFRDCLEQLSEELGVTDPVSGEAVMTLKPKKKAKKRKLAKKAAKKATSRKKPAKGKAVKKAKKKTARKAKRKAAKKRSRR
jgi:hypothetical protein